MSFDGFDDRFFAFFRELKRNNERAWFQANKARYEQEVLTPLSEFVQAMAPRLEKLAPHYVADPRPRGGSIFRIYRDLRFAKGGKPYKEHAGVHFRHEAGKDAHCPGFYVHLEPDRVFFGGGIWKPASPELKQIRDAIVHKPAGWDQVVGDRKLRSMFGGVGGESLTRPPRGFDAAHKHIEDIKRKTFFAIREESPEIAKDKSFVKEVEATFKAATPLMRFLAQAVGAAF